MIALRARSAGVSLDAELARSVWLIEEAATLTARRRGRAYLIGDSESPPAGFDLYLAKNAPAFGGLPLVCLPPLLHHLAGGDVVRLTPSGERIRVLWRAKSRQNSILLTERCDHYCLMCSQPPKRRDDEWLLDAAFELVRLLPRTTTDINFTGGEPTLYGDRLIELLKLCRALLPLAAVHLLSNGRRFSDSGFAGRYAEIGNPNMMVGIPLYGAEPALHDYVVQAPGAFDETVRGVLNLARLRQRIELRVVVHGQTVPSLVAIADFIARNLPFVEQVAFMGLEPTGLARANMGALWIDPADYQGELVEAVRHLDRRRIRTLIYNHQLCVLDRELWKFAVRSISDWKNEYHHECAACSVADACGGFFASAKHGMSSHIRAIPAPEAGRERAFLPVG